MAGLSAVEVSVKLEDGLEETGFQFESVNEPDDATGVVKSEDDKKFLLVSHESQLGVEVRPPKRRRILVLSVVVPTLALALAKQEDYKKLKKLENVRNTPSFLHVSSLTKSSNSQKSRRKRESCA